MTIFIIKRPSLKEFLMNIQEEGYWINKERLSWKKERWASKLVKKVDKSKALTALHSEDNNG